MRFGLLRRKTTPVWNIVVQGREGSAVWSTFNTAAAARTYANIDTVFSCIDTIASGCSQAAFKVTRTDSQNNVQQVYDHPALSLLARPEPMTSGPALLYNYAAWFLIGGNSYLFMNNGSDDDYARPPTEINMLRADLMRIVPGAAGIASYKFSRGGSTRTFPVEAVSQRSNVVHIRSFNPTDDFYGLSAMQAAGKNIDIYSSSLTWNKKLLDNSCRPSGLFTWEGEGNPSPEQVADIRSEIQKVTGKENAGKALFGGKLGFSQMSMSPKDVEFLSGKTMTSKDIARVYKVPPVLLNIGSDATFSNMSEARLALWDEAIIPLLKCFVSEMNHHLMPRYGEDGSVLKLDLSQVTSLEPRREAQWERARSADFLTFNERRNIVGYEDVDGGDEVMIPASSVPLTFAIGDGLDAGTADAKKKSGSSINS